MSIKGTDFQTAWRLTVKREGCGKPYKVWYTEEEE